MQYDGSGKLAEAISILCGVPPKNQVRIAKLIKEAKAGLGITSESKRLPDDVKLSIYRWHYDRLNTVQNIKQDNADPIQSVEKIAIQYIKQVNDAEPELLPDNAVQNIKQTDNDDLDLSVTTTAQNSEQDTPVQLDDDSDSAVYDFKQIHFAINLGSKRTTVMLEGYLVKALQRKHSLTDNPAIRAWIEQAIKTDGLRFDCNAPLTRQVKRIIIELFV